MTATVSGPFAPINLVARNTFANYLLDTARWRLQVAEDFPDDTRNGHAVLALAELAGIVRTDPNLEGPVNTVYAMSEAWGMGEFSPCEETWRVIGRYGFGGWQPEPVAFIEELLDLEVDGAITAMKCDSADNAEALGSLRSYLSAYGYHPAAARIDAALADAKTAEPGEQ